MPDTLMGVRYSTDGKWVVGTGGGTMLMEEVVPVTMVVKKTRKTPDGKEEVYDETVTAYQKVTKQAGGGSPQLLVWDAASGKRVATLPSCGGSDACDVSPDGTLIAMRTTEPNGASVCSATCSTSRRTGAGMGGARKLGPSGRSLPRAACLGPGRSQTTPTISRGPKGTCTKLPGGGAPASGAR